MERRIVQLQAFVSDIAQFMGLRVPKSTLIYPKVFINNLRQINTRPGKPSAAPRLSVGSAGPKVTIVSAPHHQQFRGGRVESLRTRDRDVQCDDAPPIRSDIPNPRTVGPVEPVWTGNSVIQAKAKAGDRLIRSCKPVQPD